MRVYLSDNQVTLIIVAASAVTGVAVIATVIIGILRVSTAGAAPAAAAQQSFPMKTRFDPSGWNARGFNRPPV